MTQPQPEPFDDALASVIAALAEGTRDEDRVLMEALTGRVPSLSAAVQYAKDLDLPQLKRVLRPLDKVVDGVLQAAHPTSHQARFICKHSSFVQSHFARVILQVEGNGCSTDKARAIVRKLLLFYTRGEHIQFDRTGTYTFFVPEKIFTTHEPIVSFFEGVYQMYYGQPGPYITALAQLLQTPA